MTHKLSQLLALVLFCLLTPITAFAYDFSAVNEDGVTIYYNKLSATTCAVTYYGLGQGRNVYSGSITIPASVTYSGTTYSVTSIDDYAFMFCESITSITLPNTITSIGIYAFRICSSLSSINLPNSITNIDDCAFAGCRSLSSISIPSTVTSLGNEAFGGCVSLTAITIPSSVTSIGSEAFYECSSLAAITIPSSVSSIGSEAFSGCTSLTSVNNLATAPQQISASVFDNVPLSEAILYVPAGSLQAYQNAEGWRDFGTIIEFVPDYFSVINPDGVTIRYHKQSDTECGVTLLSSNAKYSGDITIPATVTYAGHTLTVTSIDGYAFYGCKSLSSINLPNTITYISDGAFSDCTSLTSITLPNTISVIDMVAFSGCTSLTSITLPSSLSVIGDDAFSGCTSLTSITLPSSLSVIYEGAFSGCTSLTFVTVLADTPPSVGSRIFYNVPLSTATLHVPIGTQEAYAAAETWQDFGTIIEFDPNVFYATNSDGVTIRYHKRSDTECEVAKLEDGAKYSGDITIPATVAYNGTTYAVTSIGDGAFEDCTSLTSISLPNSLTSIGDRAFAGCTSLTSVTIPNSVTCITREAFSGCRSLTSISLPNSITTIFPETFSGCSSLTTINIPSSVTYIDEDLDTFGGCTSLTSITVDPDNLKYSSLDGVLFNKNQSSLVRCPGGKSGAYTIPSSVTYIETFAFTGCTNLTSITCLATTPPEVQIWWLNWDYVFIDRTNSLTLYVPAGSLDAYQNAYGWMYFGTILELNPESEPDTDITLYDDIIYVNPLEVNTGKQVTLSLQMNNLQSFVGFQCDLTLPDGMTFAKDEDDFYLADLSLERTTDKKTDYFNVELQSDGALRFLCSSTKKYTFDGNSGEVATVTINVPADIEDGEYPLILTNVVMTDEVGNTTEISYVKTTLTIFAYTLGDVNSDGSVNVGDFAATAAYILGPDVPEGFVEKAADANCDTKINVGDLAAIAAIILGPGANAAPQRANEVEATAEMTMELTASETTGEYLLYVGINNVALPFSGYQFDLVLPQGLTVKTDEDGFYEASLCEDRTNARRTDYFNSALQSDGALRVLCASTQNAMFEGETGHVAVIKLAAKDSQTQGAIELKSAMLTNGGDMTSLDDTLIVFDHSVTNIEQFRNEQSIRVYDLNGQLIRYGKNSEECLKDMPHGVYVVNGVKVVL